MFRIQKIGKPGWMNTPVTIIAVTEIRLQERRLKYHGLQVGKVEEWVLEIEAGEEFSISLPKEIKLAIGDTLAIEAVMNDEPLRPKWTKVSSF